jgi:hypothetical protein
MPIAKGYSRVSQTFFDCASSAEQKFQRATLANGADHPAAGLSKCRDLPVQIKSELRSKERLVDRASLAELFAALARAADCRGSHPAHLSSVDQLR